MQKNLSLGFTPGKRPRREEAREGAAGVQSEKMLKVSRRSKSKNERGEKPPRGTVRGRCDECEKGGLQISEKGEYRRKEEFSRGASSWKDILASSKL